MAYQDKSFASTFFQYAGGEEYYPDLVAEHIIGSMAEFEMQYDQSELSPPRMKTNGPKFRSSQTE